MIKRKTENWRLRREVDAVKVENYSNKKELKTFFPHKDPFLSFFSWQKNTFMNIHRICRKKRIVEQAHLIQNTVHDRFSNSLLKFLNIFFT